MTDKQNEKYPKFILVGEPVVLEGENGKRVVLSRQKILQENETESEHLVIKKYRQSTDGTTSDVKQLFIPYDQRLSIANLILDKFD